MSFLKWIGGGLGWAIGGPIGGIVGFALGSLLDGSEINVENPGKAGQERPVYSGTSSRRKKTTSADFSISLIVLSAAVMKSDGKTLKSELEYVKNFFVRQFGEEIALEQLKLLRDVLKQDIPLQEVCFQIKDNMMMSGRLQLIHYLFGISQADGEVNQSEIDVIEKISYYLGISAADMNSLKAMYYRDATSDYKILEISPNASNEEVKKAYRKMAMKYHPDKVSGMGESVQKAAAEKFRKLKDAYENIKKVRGMA